MKKDFSIGPKEILANHLASQDGEAVLHQCIPYMEQIVGRWKEYKNLLNFTNTYSEEQTELDGSGEGPSITGAEVTAVVKKLYSGRAPGVDEICPYYLKTLDIVGLS